MIASFLEGEASNTLAAFQASFSRSMLCHFSIFSTALFPPPIRLWYNHLEMRRSL